MYLCRFSVRYASSTNFVFKPINFKHKPRLDDIAKPFGSNRNNKFDGRSRRVSRDDRGKHPPAKERDEEEEVIRSPMAASRRSDHRNRGYVKSYEGDREDGDGNFSSRRNLDDDVGTFTNRGKDEDYRDSSKNNQGRFRGTQFTDYRVRKYDSRYNNDEFRQRNSDFRHGNREYDRDSYSKEHPVRDRQDKWYNNSRKRFNESGYGNKEHVNRDKTEKLSILSSDSSLDDVENLFGIYPVLLALRTGKRTIHKIFCKHGIETNDKIKEIYELAADNNIEVVSVDGSEIKQVFKSNIVHQGIFCLASPIPVDIFNIDSCRELQSSLIDSVILEDSSTTKNNLGCSDESPRNPPENDLINSSLNSNNFAQCASDAPLGSISDSVQEEQSSGTFSAQHSLNASINIEPADSNPTQVTSEIMPNSSSYTKPSTGDATPLSLLPDESFTGIPSTTSQSTMALSSAVALAAMQPEQDGTSTEDHLIAVPSSEAVPEQDGNSETIVTSSSDVWQQSDSKPQLWVLLDSVMDAMNVGAVLRSCCYFGVDRVLFTPSCSDISPVVSKASCGAVELLPLSLLPQPGLALAALRRRGWTVLVAVSREAESPHKPRLLHEYTMTGNTLLVVGNESSGVSASISEQADASVTIPATGPLAGALGCLNVSVAAAITLHALTTKGRG